MSKNFYKNTSFKKLILPCILIVICILALVLIPFSKALNPKDVENIYDISKDDSYVKVTTTTMYYTGYNTSKLGTSYGGYYTFDSGECVFILLPIKQNPAEMLYDYTFTAKVSSNDSQYNELLSAFSNETGWSADEISSVASDFYLDGSKSHPILFGMLFCIVVILLILSVIRIIYCIALISRSKKTPNIQNTEDI